MLTRLLSEPDPTKLAACLSLVRVANLCFHKLCLACSYCIGVAVVAPVVALSVVGFKVRWRIPARRYHLVPEHQARTISVGAHVAGYHTWLVLGIYAWILLPCRLCGYPGSGRWWFGGCTGPHGRAD
jgi:hypothetical protein